MEREWWRNSKSTALLRKIAKKIKRDGIVGSAKYLGRGAFRLADLRNSPRAGESAFDRSYGTDTDGIIPLWKLHIASRNRDAGSRCQSSDAEALRRTIEGLAIDPADFAFLDLGSGKGRALLVAAEYPFRSVCGVEFSREMHVLARANILKRRQYLKCRNVASFYGDAATWEFLQENMVIFLYNPFDDSVLMPVLENLRRSIIENTTVYIVYFNPVFSGILEDSKFLETLWHSRAEAVYRWSRSCSLSV